MAVRLKDIARDLGVSIVTVSKVLRNHSDISDETRERVLKRMKELNYQPNLAARALVTGRTYSIGLIVPDLTHAFFAEVAKGISSVLRRRSYGLLIASSEEDPDLEKQEIEHFLARHVDCIVIASAQRSTESFKRLEQNNTPYVLIDRHFAGFSANFVGIDDRRAGFLATEHLIQIGCQRIAHIRGPEVSTVSERMAGYLEALDKYGLERMPKYTIRGSTGDEHGDLSGYRSMKELIRLKPRPDGVFCGNDPLAMGALKAVLDSGLNVPEDIAVIGCGNLLYADFLRVPLSSVDQGSGDIGRQAGTLALSLVEAKTPPRPKSIYLEPRVIARESTARTQRKPMSS